MIYFFINIILYLLTILFLVQYFYHKMTINSFIIIIFNMNVFFFFIYQNINYIYGLLFLIISLIMYYFINSITNANKEIILIQNGNINIHKVLNNYSYHKLVSYLKKHHIELNEVKLCLKKGNNLTIIKKSKMNDKKTNF